MGRVIALTGANRVGKDTMAVCFEQLGFQPLKIARPIKEIVKQLFDLEDYQLETDAKDNDKVYYGKTPRQLLQWVGTDMFQHTLQQFIPEVGRNFWIEKVAKTVQDNPTKTFVISDLRFLHEYNFLYQRFGKNFQVIRIIRSVPYQVKHESDSSHTQVPIHCTYENNGTKEDMQRWVTRWNSTSK